MIKAYRLNKMYKKRKIINSFNYKFKDKGLYIIKGESGKGKTTLLNILSKEDEKFEGSLGIESSIFYLKDKDNLISCLSLKDNFYLFELANNKKMDNIFDISHLLNKKVKNLSLGEVQLVQVMLAINSDCKIIIMDEPFSALEENNLKKCSELIEILSKEKLVIIASHNFDFFNKAEIIDLNKKVNYKVNKFNSYDNREKQVLDNKYYLFYYKKCFVSKLFFLISLLFTVFSGVFSFRYSSNLVNNNLWNLKIEEGMLIEKERNIQYLNENIFYEVCKKISKYIDNYNAKYYHSSLYNYDIKVDEYYIDNGISLSSFEYIEEDLLENEVVVSFDYNLFCRNNKVFYCEEEYLKTLLVNKKIDKYNLYIKDIFNNDYTSFYVNDRFYKVIDDVEYVEYYFDVKKECISDMFSLIKKDDLLSNFNYIKIGENSGFIRYKIELANSQIIDEFEYDNYVVCLDKGYDCLNYLNRFESIVRIDDFNELNNVYLGIYNKNMGLDEIAISSSLSELLDKDKGDEIRVYFKYNDLIYDYCLYIKEVIKSERYCLYHNSSWGYDFFKDVIGFNGEDLLIKNIIVYENVKEGYKKSEDIYKEVLIEINSILDNIKKVTFIINIIITLSSLIVLIILEVFNNKFKKEYFSYLRRLNIEKKNA